MIGMHKKGMRASMGIEVRVKVGIEGDNEVGDVAVTCVLPPPAASHPTRRQRHRNREFSQVSEYDWHALRHDDVDAVAKRVRVAGEYGDRG